MVFLFGLQNCSVTFLILRRIHRDRRESKKLLLKKVLLLHDNARPHTASQTV